MALNPLAEHFNFSSENVFLANNATFVHLLRDRIEFV